MVQTRTQACVRIPVGDRRRVKVNRRRRRTLPEGCTLRLVFDTGPTVAVEPATAVRRNPSRLTTRAATTTLIAQLKKSGTMALPASVADPPRTPCTKSGM